MMSFYQIIVFKILCFGLSVLFTKKPLNIFKGLTGNEEGQELRRSSRAKKIVPSQNHFQSRSFRNFFLKHYNDLPSSLRNIYPKIPKEKKKLKAWVEEHVQMHNAWKN